MDHQLTLIEDGDSAHRAVLLSSARASGGFDVTGLARMIGVAVALQTTGVGEGVGRRH